VLLREWLSGTYTQGVARGNPGAFNLLLWVLHWSQRLLLLVNLVHELHEEAHGALVAPVQRLRDQIARIHLAIDGHDRVQLLELLGLDQEVLGALERLGQVLDAYM
jgi:hypothetical protein